METKKLTPEQKKKKRNWKNIGLIALCIFIPFCLIFSCITLFFIGNFEDKPKKIHKKVNVRKRSKITEENLEQIVEKIFIKTLGTTVNWEGNPARVISVKKDMQVAGPDEGGYRVAIEYRLDDNLTTSLMKAGIFFDAEKVFKSIFNDPACAQIKICVLQSYSVLTDMYGNEEETPVSIVKLRRAIAQKINWENMYTDLFQKVIRTEGSLWIHPALEK